jgi:hypothetical protein
MFRRDERRIYLARPLEDIPWIEHGFGTRHSADWTPPERTATLRQIHSDRVVVADSPGARIAEGDAMITDRAGVLLAVRTADCLPILLADERRRLVAAVHAGWRGTVARIVLATVEELAGKFGCRPQDLRVAIGPGIGPCCYEVGPEVTVQFDPSVSNGRTIDLLAANRRQLETAGVPPERIVAAAVCTRCEAAEFHSWRRNPGHDRMLSAIGIRP